MLIRGNDVIGLKVITLDSGKLLNKVQDIVYDPQSNMVRALVLDEGGWFSDAKVLLFDEIHSIGKDAVIIDGLDKVKKASEVTSRVASIAKDNNNLTKTRVFTENGNDLGSIEDILFDDKTGRVEEFEVSQGIKDLQSGRKTIKVSHIITVGQDATIVSKSAEEDFAVQTRERGVSGSMNRAVRSVKDKTPGILDQLRGQAQILTERARDQFSQLSASSMDEFEDLRSRVAGTVDEYRNDPETQQMLKDAQNKLQEAREVFEGAVQRGSSEAREKFKQVKENAPEYQQSAQNTLSETGENLKDLADKVSKQAQEMSKTMSQQPPIQNREEYRAYAQTVTKKEPVKGKKSTSKDGEKEVKEKKIVKSSEKLKKP